MIDDDEEKNDEKEEERFRVGVRVKGGEKREAVLGLFLSLVSGPTLNMLTDDFEGSSSNNCQYKGLSTNSTITRNNANIKLWRH